MIHFGYLVPREGEPNPYALGEIREEHLDYYTGPLHPSVDARLKQVVVKV